MVYHDIHINFQIAISGWNVHVYLYMDEFADCTDCSGTGTVNESTCGTCNGTGHKPLARDTQKPLYIS